MSIMSLPTVTYIQGTSGLTIGSMAPLAKISTGLEYRDLSSNCIPHGYIVKFNPMVRYGKIVIDHNEKIALTSERNPLPKECFENNGYPTVTFGDFSNGQRPTPDAPQPNSPRYTPGMSITDFVNSEINKEEKSGNPDRVRLKWLHTFQRCVLPTHVKQTIEEALIVVLNSDKFDSWGINDTFEKGITNSILLYGPPGTGKTMIAESIAAVLNQSLMSLDTADLQSQIPGQMERNIKNAFEKADAEDAVLLIDECDSLLYDRSAVGMIIAAEINTLLREIENFDGVCILTTNRLGHLDPALQRRIIAKVELGLPSEEQRREIWKKLLPVKMPVKDLNFDLLSLHPISGGDIKNAILLAARKAVAANMEHVTQEHFNQVLAHIVKAKDDFKKQTGRPAFFKQAGHEINKWASA